MMTLTARVLRVVGAVAWISASAAVAQDSCDLGVLVAWDGGQLGDWFSEGLDVDDEFMVVGTPFSNEFGPNSGSAYVFRWDGATWTEDAKLLASDASARSCFGMEVALDGDRMVITSPHFDSTRGAAHVFRRESGLWVEEQKLLASDGEANDWFGAEVSMAGDRLVIGAPRDDADRGAAYVFRLDGAVWVEEAKLVASDGVAGDQFGWAVPFEGDRLVVGASFADDRRGAVYVFERSGNAWLETAKITPADGEPNDRFGEAASLRGDLFAAGAFGDDDLGNASGSVYLFAFDGSTWSEQAKLLASDGGPDDYFGQRGVALSPSADFLAVGAPQRDLVTAAGKVYMFRFDGNGWVEHERFVGSDAAPGDDFGYKVALGDRFLAVGAPQAGTPDPGKAYGFGVGADCNANGTADTCDIAGGGSTDDNANGIPDECEGIPCSDVQSLLARCVGGTLRAAVRMTAASHDGELVTVDMAGQPLTRPISGNMARFGRLNQTGQQTVCLVDPDCPLCRTVDCGP